MEYEKKLDLQQKWQTEATSILTITGENDRGYKHPKKGLINGPPLLITDDKNLISNKQWG